MYSVKEFTEEELKWTKPFDKSETIVFVSDKNEFDTIVFKKSTLSDETVNDLERGFYKSNYLVVPYEFSKGSFHQFDFDGNTPSEQYLITIEKSSAGFGGLGINFFGLLVDQDDIKNASKMDTKTYRFNKENLSRFNTANDISYFTFNTDIGIVNYTDGRNVKWARK
jgi:hypothetical protein